MKKDILIKHFLILLFSFSAFSTEIEILNEFGHPLIPDAVFSESERIAVTGNRLVADSNLYIFSKNYLPYYFKPDIKKNAKIFLQRRKLNPVTVNIQNPVFILIQHKIHTDYYESYLFYKDIYLPEFSDNEMVYIYSEGYIPQIIFNSDLEQNSIELEKANIWIKIDFPDDIPYEGLYQNNITPDRYFAAPNPTTLNISGYGHIDTASYENGDTVILEKEIKVTFFSHVINPEFRIFKNRVKLKSELYYSDQNTIYGLTQGEYEIHFLKAGIPCRVFTNVLLQSANIYLGAVTCSLKQINIRVLNSESLPVENAEIELPQLKKTFLSDIKGMCKIQIDPRKKLQLLVKKEGYAPVIKNIDHTEKPDLVEITLTGGAALSILYSKMENNTVIKGISSGENTITFVKNEKAISARNITAGKYHINFRDLDTGFNRKLTIELEDGESRVLNIEDNFSSISGTLSPSLPDNLTSQCFIEFSGEKGQFKAEILNHNTFFLENLPPGKYRVNLKSATLKTFYTDKSFHVNDDSKNIDVLMDGFFWDGEIIFTENIHGCRVIMTNSKSGTLSKTYYDKFEKILFIPEKCTMIEFRTDQNIRKFTTEEFSRTDTLFLW